MTSCIRVQSVGGETPSADPRVNEYNTDCDDSDESNEIFKQCRSLLVDHGPSFLVKQKTGYDLVKQQRSCQPSSKLVIG